MKKLLRAKIKKDIKIRMQNDRRSILRIVPRVRRTTFINKIRFLNSFPWSIK